MQRLTPSSSPIQVACNDETCIIVSHDFAQLACVHCGNLKNGYVIFQPGMLMDEYEIKKALIKQQPRCLCKHEVRA